MQLTKIDFIMCFSFSATTFLKMRAVGTRKTRRMPLGLLPVNWVFSRPTGSEEVVHMSVDHDATSKGIVQVVDAWFKSALFETKGRQAFLDVQVEAATCVLRTTDGAQGSYDMSQGVHARRGLVTAR